MESNPLLTVKTLGQSIWLDYIQRDPLENGELARMIEQDGLSSMTSNPAIFEQAIAEHDDYKHAIAKLVRRRASATEIYESLTIEDVSRAADLLRPVYDETHGRDGFVSLEVSPHLAYDTEQTITEAIRLWVLLDRPNIMIKVPATHEGLAAIRALIANGVNVNVTLLFGLERYHEVVEAFLAGLEERAADNQPVDQIASVASFFLSRIDTLVDARLNEISQDSELVGGLHGETAIALARLAYQGYKQLFGGPRWQRLAECGARTQRLLWASTSTKDPVYSDIKYVEALIGADTVNTMPPQTLQAYRDHGKPALRLEDALDQAHNNLERLDKVGIELSAASEQLEREGVQKFIDPYDKLLATLAQ